MNILFSKNSFAGPISGADEIAVNYAVELKAAGHSTGVLLVHPPSRSDPLAARLHAAGVPLAALASPAFSNSLAAGRKVAIRAMRMFSPASRLIRSRSRNLVFDLLQRYHDVCCDYLERHRPDVLHVMTPDPGAVMLIRAAHATRVPVVYQEVGIPFHPPGFEEVYERFVTVLPLCAGVAVLSPLLAKEIAKVLPHLAPASVVPLISQASTNGAQREAASDCVSFGFAARLEHLKGPLKLIQGFHIAQRMRSNIELRIAGEGSQRQEITVMLDKLGLVKKCQLLGVYTTLKERHQFMSTIDVMVLPSLTEGTPNVIIEGMAHGKPIIATTVGGIPDLVSEEEGILVSPGDEQALGNAMARLAGDLELRQKMGHAAREKYQRIFAPNVVLPLLLDFYQSVINGHGTANGNGNNGNAHSVKDLLHPWSAARS